MNKVYLNTVSLAKEPVINKGASAGGSGSGVTINNQEKSLEITENGVTEVTADAGFTGLSKVVVNTNVQSGGGGSDMPVIGDGKTHLYITIAAEGRMDVPLYFTQSVANGVTIDWGDGSAPQTIDGTGNKTPTHKYAAIGDYVISLDPVDGCTLGLGSGNSSYCVMGDTYAMKAYCNMLRGAEIGKGVKSIGNYAFSYCTSLSSVAISESVTSIGNYAFSYCTSLSSVVIPESVTSIGNYAFSYCSALSSVVIPESVTSIGSKMFYGCDILASVEMPNIASLGDSMFYNCSSLSLVVIPESVTSIGKSAFSNCSSLLLIEIPAGVTSLPNEVFYNCKSMAYCDFSRHLSVPSLPGSNVFSGIASDCKIIVPDALYDEWIAATNWSKYASYIIKKSDWDAQS